MRLFYFLFIILGIISRSYAQESIPDNVTELKYMTAALLDAGKNLPPFYSANSEKTWTSSILGTSEDVEGSVIKYSGEGDNTFYLLQDFDCEQDFFVPGADLTDLTAYPAGWDIHNFKTANDLLVPANSTFALQHVTLAFSVFNEGEPTEFTLQLYNDNGSSGVGSAFGSSYTFTSDDFIATYIGMWEYFPMYEISVDVSALNMILENDTSSDKFYWLGIEDAQSTNDYIVYWHFSNYTEGNTNPAWVYNGGEWILLEEGGIYEGAFKVEGICEELEVEDCQGTPDAGEISLSPDAGLPETAYTVSSIGTTNANDLIFQWQSNTNEAGWINEGDATDIYTHFDAIAPVDPNTLIDWRLSVTCVNSGETSFSETATFTVWDPQDGCDWTVRVFDNTGVFGNEVSWSLADDNGNILLSGGRYLTPNYNDIQTVFTVAPVTFTISNEGDWGNTPKYEISNDNGIIESGELSSDPQTLVIENLICDNTPPPPPNLTCEENYMNSNNFEDGQFFGGDFGQRLAVDIIVGDEGFTVYGLDLNVFVEDSTDLFFDFIFYANDNNAPGTVVHEIEGEIISFEQLGSGLDLDFYNYVVAFDTAVSLDPNNIYWMEVSSNAFGWESRSDEILGSPAVYLNDNIEDWMSTDSESVYALVCEALLNINDVDTFNFTLYPNPTTDVLNIKSNTEIESVEGFTITGAKIFSETNPQSSQFDIGSLSSGTYIFRVTSKEGQVENFKIIKN